jgi:hypothetical protein
LHSVGVMVSVARGEERSDESEVDLLGWFCAQGKKEDHEEVAHGCPEIQQTKGIKIDTVGMLPTLYGDPDYDWDFVTEPQVSWKAASPFQFIAMTISES